MPEIRNNPDIYPPDEVIEKLQFMVDVGETTRLYDRVWTRVQAAGN
jgi:spermidine/putrescine transport system substrate-binding protein